MKPFTSYLNTSQPYCFLKPSTAFNIIPTTLQNVQLQVKLLPRMQENAPLKKKLFMGGIPPDA